MDHISGLHCTFIPYYGMNSILNSPPADHEAERDNRPDCSFLEARQMGMIEHDRRDKD